MQRRKQELEELKDQVRKRGKKFVSYKEGADLYSLGLHTFEKLADRKSTRLNSSHD